MKNDKKVELNDIIAIAIGNKEDKEAFNPIKIGSLTLYTTTAVY